MVSCGRSTRISSYTRRAYSFGRWCVRIPSSKTLLGTLSRERGAEALEDFKNIAFVRYPHASLADRIWELKDNLTTYDAAYIALAEALDTPLITLDARLAQVPGIRAAVEVYG
jgi:predicted nucleic acid-binding protein